MIKYAALSLLLIGYISGSENRINSVILDTYRKMGNTSLEKIEEKDFNFILDIVKKATDYEDFESIAPYCDNILNHSEFLTYDKSELQNFELIIDNNNTSSITKKETIDIKKPSLSTKNNNKGSVNNKKNQKKSNKNNNDDQVLNQYIEQNKKIDQNQAKKNELTRNQSIQQSLKYFEIETALGEIKSINSGILKQIVDACEEKKMEKALSLLDNLKNTNPFDIYIKIFENIKTKFANQILEYEKLSSKLGKSIKSKSKDIENLEETIKIKKEDRKKLKIIKTCVCSNCAHYAKELKASFNNRN